MAIDVRAFIGAFAKRTHRMRNSPAVHDDTDLLASDFQEAPPIQTALPGGSSTRLRRMIPTLRESNVLAHPHQPNPRKDPRTHAGRSEICIMKKALALAFLCLPGIGLAQDIHIVHCLAGCPTGTPNTNDLVVREIYALSNNEKTKFADWVAYRVTRETIGTSDSLNRSWQDDELLDADDTLEENDYDGASRALRTDRGHQAPLASFAGTHFWRVTNILSNITPQKSALNQGPWVRLEAAVRDAAYATGRVYVVTGPIFDPDEEAMQLPRADEPHIVPTGYFKVVAHSTGRLAAFLFDQDVPRRMDFCDGLVTLRHVETASGLDLFPHAPDWPTGSLETQLGCRERAKTGH